MEKFKISNDPQFEDKVRDVVGLYLDPPDRALVLCVDEKSQIQALDRTAPILPLRPGLPERQTIMFQRNSTGACDPLPDCLPIAEIIRQAVIEKHGDQIPLFVKIPHHVKVMFAKNKLSPRILGRRPQDYSDEKIQKIAHQSLPEKCQRQSFEG